MRISIVQELSRKAFIDNYLRKGVPCVFKGAFSYFPALSKWITSPAGNTRNAELNLQYFFSQIEASGKDPLVDVESGRFSHTTTETHHSSTPTSPDGPNGFFRTQIPLSLFLRLQNMRDVPKEYAKLYLAQTPLLSSLPALLEDVVPKPKYLPDASHIYGSSAWIGRNTYTPRHFDPNENLYVMIAGKKRVVLWEPSVVGEGRAKRRGALSNDNFSPPAQDETPWDEVEINPGDGLYIPERWWHEVESLSPGVTASVNWWFREPAK
ncbi:hypothetical protein V1525DRAFT_409328 [Lipomyces kononenkoae]|uniref:Uncharacterized protein n=1 Tax=Lipomyces kononenkoae TaxID=34357 RepID=A0ACC3SW40_LIPKO